MGIFQTAKIIGKINTSQIVQSVAARAMQKPLSKRPIGELSRAVDRAIEGGISAEIERELKRLVESGDAPTLGKRLDKLANQGKIGTGWEPQGYYTRDQIREIDKEISTTLKRLDPYASKLHELLPQPTELQKLAESGDVVGQVHQKYKVISREALDRRVQESLPDLDRNLAVLGYCFSDFTRAFPMIRGALGRSFVNMARIGGVSPDYILQEIKKLGEIIDALPDAKMVGPQTFKKLAELAPVQVLLSRLVVELLANKEVDQKKLLGASGEAREVFQDAVDSAAFRQELEQLEPELRESIEKLAKQFKIDLHEAGTTRISRAEVAVTEIEGLIETVQQAIERGDALADRLIQMDPENPPDELTMVARELAEFSKQMLEKTANFNTLKQPSREGIIQLYARQKEAGTENAALRAAIERTIRDEFGSIGGSEAFKEIFDQYKAQLNRAGGLDYAMGRQYNSYGALPKVDQMSMPYDKSGDLASKVEALEAIQRKSPGSPVGITVTPSGEGTYNVSSLLPIANGSWDNAEYPEQNAATPEDAIAKAHEQYYNLGDDAWLALGSEGTQRDGLNVEIKVGLDWTGKSWSCFEEDDNGNRASHIDVL